MQLPSNAAVCPWASQDTVDAADERAEGARSTTMIADTAHAQHIGRRVLRAMARHPLFDLIASFGDGA